VLARSYEAPPPPEEFADDVKRLAAASLLWARDVAPRVASRGRG
jgi:hypothetical protein